MPIHSTQDVIEIHEWMRRGKLFCKVHDNRTRDKIEERIVSCERIVTMESFMEDSRLLKACADGLNKLIPFVKRRKESLRTSMRNCFQARDKSFEESYVDVCCQAVRQFRYLSQGKYSNPRKDKGQPTPDVRPRDWQKLGSLAYLAASVGFESQNIDELIAQAREPLKLESVVVTDPALSSICHDLSKTQRSNRAGEKAYNQICQGLFANAIIHTPRGQREAHPTSFAVVRDIFLRFWGDCVPADSVRRIFRKEHHKSAPAFSVLDTNSLLTLQNNMTAVRGYQSVHLEHEQPISSNQTGIAKDVGLVEGTPQEPVNSPSPTSSVRRFGNPDILQGKNEHDRFLQTHQYMQHVIEPRDIDISMQAQSPHRSVAGCLEPIEGTLLVPTYLPRPASSIYDDSGQSPSTPGSTQHLPSPNENLAAKNERGAKRYSRSWHGDSEQQTGRCKKVFRVTKPGHFEENKMTKRRKETLQRAWQHHAETLGQFKQANTYIGLIPPFPADDDSPAFEDDQYERTSVISQTEEDSCDAVAVMDKAYDGNTKSSGDEEASVETDGSSIQDGAWKDHEHNGDEMMFREEPQLAAADDLCLRSHLEKSRKQRAQNEDGKAYQILLKRHDDQARIERTDDVLHRIQVEAGSRNTKHRVEKLWRAMPKEKAKKREAKIVRVLQSHADTSREKAPQFGLTTRSGDDDREVDNANINAIHQLPTVSLYETEEHTNTSSTIEPVISQAEVAIESGNEESVDASNADHTSNTSTRTDENGSIQPGMEKHEMLESCVQEHRLESLRKNNHGSSHLTRIDVDENRAYSDCDVDSGMRDVAEQIRSATDVADEVYVNSVLSRFREEVGLDDNGVVNFDRSTTSSLLLGEQKVPQSRHTETNGIPPGNSRKAALDEFQDEGSNLIVSSRRKRKAIRDAEEIGYEPAYALSDSNTSHQLLDPATTSYLESGIKGREDRPKSEFPGVSMNFAGRKQVLDSPSTTEVVRLDESPTLIERTNRIPLPAASVIGKKRKWEGEVESMNVNIRSPKRRVSAQLSKWNSVEDLVASVERISAQLDCSLRIYVTSTVDIEILAPRRELIHQRLWSWSRTERVQFHSQVSRLLLNGHDLQLVTSTRTSTERKYTYVSHMDCWRTYFRDDSPYWLAILLPKPAKSLMGRR